MNRNDHLLNPAAAAALLGIHPKTLNDYERRGLIEAKRTPGGHRRYKREDVEGLLEKQEESA